MRILVVDDARAVRALARATLEGLGDVLEAEDGEEAWAILTSEGANVDLALVDCEMPRLDGLGLLRRLKGAVPVIMVTGGTNVAEAQRSGAVDCVLKPFTPAELREKVVRVLARIATTTPRSNAALAGTLDKLPMADLVQILYVCRKSGVLRVERTDGQKAELYFKDGEMRHASAGPLTGESAFFATLAWTSGSFAFEIGVASPGFTTPHSTMSLLLEGTRILSRGG